jgi:hypothetical protein
MSISDVIDVRYRLMPNDLGGKPRQVFVRSVTLQGVEELTPLVHFEGFGRPLALDLDQRMQMATIAHSAILSDWIGATLILQPDRLAGSETIQLRNVGSSGLRAGGSLDRRTSAPRTRSWLRIVLFALLLAAAFAAASLVESAPSIDALLDLFGR